MNQTLSISPDRDQIRAARRPRTSLPALPWVELLGFLILIAMTLRTGG